MLKLIIACVLLTVASVIQCKSDYVYRPKADGWFKLHKIPTIWKNAFFQCNREGAVLASPINEAVLSEMLSIISANNDSLQYFTGIHARFSPGQFVSVEGIPLENMNASDMFQVLNTQNGECLSMDGYNMTVVSCEARLPYICYKKIDGMLMTECGTFDKAYRYVNSTGSCYKVHTGLNTWYNANSICISEGGHLAIINDEQEALEVKDMIPEDRHNFTWDRKWDHLFIGLRAWDDKDTYLSIHGEPISQLYNSWDENQPDPYGQLCGGLIRTGKLDNVWCDKESYFICEKNPRSIRFSDEAIGQYDQYIYSNNDPVY
ncbi:lymphocyte antigen 75-like [Anticarsia gemmatalis]|uniref:lymphocyte antigen 75-like n=1 Tax=Anticarsia gemmatalis TaxID=129554 RepID=UPI003F759BFA